jgi:DNA-binding SARP family transcriptional activator/ABC-type transport system substrate-binding protein/streptogramin lyase
LPFERGKVEFRLLGPLEVVREDGPIRLGGARQRALLALLLLHANEDVSRDVLIDAIWSDRPPGTAAHSLDVQISRLRKAFAPAQPLVTRAGGYSLRLDHAELDVRRFEELLERGRRANALGSPEEALEALDAGLALWRGAPIADVAYEAFARADVERLEELRVVAVEERIDTELALGRHDTVAAELEPLIAQHPLRERLRAQRMLALYRCGRQAEALAVYADTRKRLVDELGIEPSQSLKELERAILRQDATLEPRRRRTARSRRRAVAAVALVGAAAAAAALAVAFTRGGTGDAKASAELAQPDSNALLSATSGDLLRQTPVPGTARLRFGGGALWSVSSDGELTRLDPATGKVVARLGLGVNPGGLAAGGRSVWVTDAHSPTLYRIDPALNVPAQRMSLPMHGVVTTQTNEVAVGAGSVWVGHGQFNPGAWVERLDPATGRVEHRFSVLGGGAEALAFGEGALWVGSPGPGELRRIDPRTNELSLVARLHGELCCVAAGGGYVWAAINPDSTIWKLTPRGSPIRTFKLRAPIEHLTYAAGALWAAGGHAGTVVRIDPLTDAIRTYRVGHEVTDVDARGGVLAAGVVPKASAPAASAHGVPRVRTELAVARTRSDGAGVLAGLKGRVVRVGLKSSTLFWSGAPTDPALYASWDMPQMEFHYATCAKLLNYPDVEGAKGRKLVPEVAAAFPKVSNGGRTYTFRLRRGYRFSPPSNQPVTAAAFQHQIERVTSPDIFPGSDIGPEIVVGATAYHAGKAAHISGISAHGNTLVIRLVKPVPGLPWVLADVPYCAVPPSTPVVPYGVETPVPSAGPYYLAQHTDSFAVLKRNPNYRGPRRPQLDSIVYEFAVKPGDAAARIAKGTLDYVAEYDPALAPNGAAARLAGSRYRFTPDSTGSVKFLQFNVGRPLFSNIRLRRAVQYAIDRRALAALEGDIGAMPATRLLSSRLPGFSATPIYPLRPNLRKARDLMGGRHVRAVFATFDPTTDPYGAAFAKEVQRELARIGLTTTVIPLTNADYANGTLAQKFAQSDLIWGGGSANSADPVPYLQDLFLPKSDRARLAHIATLSSPRREQQAAALVAKIERQSLFAVYANGAVAQIVSRRLGCVVHQPEYGGVDLAALCLKGSAK